MLSYDCLSYNQKYAVSKLNQLLVQTLIILSIGKLIKIKLDNFTIELKFLFRELGHVLG